MRHAKLAEAIAPTLSFWFVTLHPQAGFEIIRLPPTLTVR